MADDTYTDPMGAVVPAFTPETEEPSAVVPVPPTPAAAPEDKPPRQRPLGETIRGAWRSGTLFGATTEDYNQGIVQGEPGRVNRFRDAIRALNGPEGDTPYPDLSKQLDEKKRLAAEQAIAEQIAYEKSDPYYSGTNLVGTILGGMGSPESYGGLSGLIARKVPILAGKALGQVIVRQGLDAAITNTVTDPVVQALRMRSGAQENYDVGQTAMAPVLGFAVGGALGGAGHVAGPLFARMGRKLPITPIEEAVKPPKEGATPAPEVPPATQTPQKTIADVLAEPEPRSPTQAADAAPMVNEGPPAALPPSPDRPVGERFRLVDPIGQTGKTLDVDVIRNPKGEIEGLETGRGRVQVPAELRSEKPEVVIAEMLGDRGNPADVSPAEIPPLVPTDRGAVEPLPEIPTLPQGPQPQSLVDYIRANGGVVDANGDLKAMGFDRHPGLITKNGQSLDAMRESAAAMGYLGHDLDHAVSGTTVADFLDKIAEHPTYSIHDETRVQDRATLQEYRDRAQLVHDAHESVRNDVTAEGIEPDPHALRRAADILAQGEARSPVGAYEQAIAEGALARRRGGNRPPPLENQMEKGRPRFDQGTAGALTAKSARVEDISKQLAGVFNTIARIGKVTPGAQGIYKIESGVVRVKKVSDLDTLAHEIGHQLHLGMGAKSEFDRVIQANERELARFDAGKSAEDNAEAFANLFHAYVVSPRFGERNFPNAMAHLDGLIRRKYPEAAAQIDAVRQSLDYLHRAPSGEVVSADTITTQPPKFGDRFKELASKDRDPFGRVVYSAFDALYSNVVDLHHPVYKAVEGLAAIAKANGKTVDLKPLNDAYILARRMSSSAGRADAMLKYGVVPVGGVSPDGPSLASGIEKALGRQWDDAAFHEFGAYLAARRMVAEYQRFFAGELDRAPGKLSLGDYQQAVAQFEAAHPTWAEGAADIYAFQQNYLKRQFDKGLITKEFFQTASERQDYVPLQRDMRDFVDQAAKVRGGGKDVALLAKSVAQKFKGSDRSVINPLESIFKRVHDLEYVVARNDTMNALADLAKYAGPGSGFIYEDVPNNKLTPQRVDVIEALRSAGKAAGVDEADLHQLIMQAEDVLGESTWATLFRQEPIKPGHEPIVYRWVGGERRAGRLADGRFGRELHHALTVMGDHERDTFASVLAMSSAMLRAGVTKSMDFVLVNAIRDQITSALTGGRKYIPFVSMADGLMDALTKAQAARDFAAQGGLAGGAIVEAMDSSQFGKNVKSLQGHGWFHKLLAAPEFSETGTRVGLYKSYLKQAAEMGFDDENAALYAAFKADDYIDFRRHGAAMGSMRRLFTFMNAGIQGTDREVRGVADLIRLEAKRGRGETLSTQELDRLSDARVAMIRLATLATVGGAGLAVLNANNDRTQNASKYNRATNFLFSAMGVDFAIPKGFGVVQTVVNAFERGAEFALRRDPKLATEWLEGAAQAFTTPLSNPAMTMWYDLPANYDRFRDRPIVPYYMQGWDPTEQYTRYTSALAKQIARAADMVGLSISPMKIDFALNGLGGGMARDVLFGWDAMMGVDRPEKQIYDYPVLRRFVKNLDRGSQATDAFYKLVGDKTGAYDQAKTAYQGKIANGERQDADRLLNSMDADTKAWTIMQTMGFPTEVKRMHPMENAKERVAIINGLSRQILNNNVIKEADLDRRDMTRSRRDATPIALTPRERAQLQEDLTELSVATTRNAMVAVGAKGTTGLNLMPTRPIEERIRAISPEVADEFAYRLEGKHLPDAATAAKNWPEMKRRLLADGESADFSDMVRKAKRRRR